ncbi:Ig-like domain-containing protein [Specibacter sp. NPDC057265]|uniref:L,D-transpeptidase n=1 Tax=Specibacter sp. NPDC057265 TaxID=3346075 RepID=UPI003642F499
MAELEETKKSRRGLRMMVVSLLALGLTLTGCSAIDGTSRPGATASSSAGRTTTPTPSAPPANPAVIALNMKDGATFVNPVTPISAEVTHGKVSHVVLKETATGAVTEGTAGADGRSWVNKGPLKFNTGYTFNVTAVDADGNKTTKVSTFTTVPASHEADAVLYPAADSTVGVAQPLQFVFSEPVVNKEAVEKAIKITSSAGQAGAFRWYSDTLVRYRAADFWAANSSINVDMKLLGMDLGNGMIANFNKNYNIQIGNKVVMEANAATHSVSVFVNDVVARTFPATLGDADFPSASGYMVITGDKQRYATFKAASIGLKPGDPGDYGSVDVEFASRLSNSGIFIHQATPSAMPYLGVANLSHGCIGLSPEGAGWVFENMRAGDLVHTVGTPNETIAATDGFGDWNIPFEVYASR